MTYSLHPRLNEDCTVIGQFELCQLLMMNDAHYPWFILVPMQADISEIYQLNEENQQMLLAESSFLSERLMAHFKADKLNIAALGNIVPQLHVHHVLRYTSDPAWPSPVWGHGEAVTYDDEEMKKRIKESQNLLQDRLVTD